MALVWMLVRMLVLVLVLVPPVVMTPTPHTHESANLGKNSLKKQARLFFF
jgi:hypothetical protein